MNTVKNYHNGHGMGDISRAGTGSHEEVAVLAAGEHWQFVVERRRPREEGEEEEEAERVVCQPLRVLRKVKSAKVLIRIRGVNTENRNNLL